MEYEPIIFIEMEKKNTKHTKGRIELITGPMFSGKLVYLITQIKKDY